MAYSNKGTEKKYLLEVIVFISGAVLMVLEIVGARLLAPYLGTSTIVWTSLIGVILGSLSLGYWWGGRMADATQPNYKKLSYLLVLAALGVFYVALFQELILTYFQESVSLDLRLSSFLAATILFAPASVVLGMISPYAVKLRVDSLEKTGSAVGNLYAVSTIGSIVGTFLAGFVLLIYFGSTNILYILAVVLIGNSLLAAGRAWFMAKAGLLVAVIVSASYSLAIQEKRRNAGFVDVDTGYNRVWIYNRDDQGSGRRVREMLTNNEHSSAMFLEGQGLVYTYTRYYRLAGHIKPDLQRALMIGGAGYSYPKDFLNQFPNADLDVVELDPQLTELAHQYFRLPRNNPHLRIFHEDGRIFLNNNREKYDFIFGDAFRSIYSIPYQLTTQEAVRKMYDSLNPEGALIMNVISGIEGESGQFLRAEYATLKSVFPQVFVFPVQMPDQSEQTQNVILLAWKSEKEFNFSSQRAEIQGYLNHHWKTPIPADLPILTDDFAPVDRYIMDII